MKVSLALPAGPRDDLVDVAGLRVGHATVPGGESGCTVVLGPFRAVVEVPGLAGGSREFVTLDSAHISGRANALLFTGGSAYGLAAADGVMGWLEERGEGFPTGVGVVPIVPAAVLYDLARGRPRPGPAEGRAACEAALEPAAARPPRQSGAGAGARVGKLLGPEASMAGGMASTSVRMGDHIVAAFAVVNALGDIVGPDGTIVAGARPDLQGPPVDGMAALLASREGPGQGTTRTGAKRGEPRDGPRLGAPWDAAGNTTLCLVATDAPLGYADLRRMVRLASTALPRRITPVFTPFDGDVIFGVVPDAAPDAASGKGLDEGPGPGRHFAPADLLALGVAAREALERALLRAVGYEP